MSKIAPSNGSCAQNSEGIAVADQCKHLLTCSAMCPRWAPAASFAWFCILSCWCTFLSNFCVAMAEQLCSIHSGFNKQLCWRQNLGSPLENDPKTTKIEGWVILWYKSAVFINSPIQTHRFPMNLIVGTCSPDDACQPMNIVNCFYPQQVGLNDGPGQFLGSYMVNRVHTTRLDRILTLYVRLSQLRLTSLFFVPFLEQPR